jgi:hypothetical protein
MVKPLWALVGAGLLGTAAVAGAVIVASCGGEDKAAQRAETAAPTATPGEQTATLPGGYEFSYPASWYEIVVSDDNPYIAKFFLSSERPSTETPVEGEFGDLEVFAYENPEEVPLEEFFNGQERPNLFTDAAGGHRPFSVGEARGYWFDSVLGLTNSTVVALALDGFVYEFADPDQKHESDGVFLEIVSSLKRVEG